MWTKSWCYGNVESWQVFTVVLLNALSSFAVLADCAMFIYVICGPECCCFLPRSVRCRPVPRISPNPAGQHLSRSLTLSTWSVHLPPWLLLVFIPFIRLGELTYTLHIFLPWIYFCCCRFLNSHVKCTHLIRNGLLCQVPHKLTTSWVIFSSGILCSFVWKCCSTFLVIIFATFFETDCPEGIVRYCYVLLQPVRSSFLPCCSLGKSGMLMLLD